MIYRTDIMEALKLVKEIVHVSVSGSHATLLFGGGGGGGGFLLLFWEESKPP